MLAPQRAVDELAKQLRERQERQTGFQAQLEKARADVGAAELDGKLTEKQRSLLANLESDARINDARCHLLDRQATLLPRLRRRSSDSSQARAAVRNRACGASGRALKAAALEAIQVVNSCTSDIP
jgi:DNA repair exonuclease SbcCD ATPase subunit